MRSSSTPRRRDDATTRRATTTTRRRRDDRSDRSRVSRCRARGVERASSIDRFDARVFSATDRTRPTTRSRRHRWRVRPTSRSKSNPRPAIDRCDRTSTRRSNDRRIARSTHLDRRPRRRHARRHSATDDAMSDWADDSGDLPPLSAGLPPPPTTTTTTTIPKPSTSVPAPQVASPQKSGYVPPHLRNRHAAAGDGGSRGFGASTTTARRARATATATTRGNF